MRMPRRAHRSPYKVMMGTAPYSEAFDGESKISASASPAPTPPKPPEQVAHPMCPIDQIERNIDQIDRRSSERIASGHQRSMGWKNRVANISLDYTDSCCFRDGRKEQGACETIQEGKEFEQIFF